MQPDLKIISGILTLILFSCSIGFMISCARITARIIADVNSMRSPEQHIGAFPVYTPSFGGRLLTAHEKLFPTSSFRRRLVLHALGMAVLMMLAVVFLAQTFS